MTHSKGPSPWSAPMYATKRPRQKIVMVILKKPWSCWTPCEMTRNRIRLTMTSVAFVLSCAGFMTASVRTHHAMNAHAHPVSGVSMMIVRRSLMSCRMPTTHAARKT